MRCVHCFFETFDDTHECVALRCIKNSSLVRAATSCTDEFSWACHTRTELSSVQLTATLILVPLNRLEKFTRACCLFTLLFCFYDKKGAGNDGGIEKKTYRDPKSATRCQVSMNQLKFYLHTHPQNHPQYEAQKCFEQMI